MKNGIFRCGALPEKAAPFLCVGISHNAVGYARKSVFSTSFRFGTEGEAPFLETQIAAAFAAVSSASLTALPAAMLCRKKPANVSPAAVVSTAFTRNAL